MSRRAELQREVSLLIASADRDDPEAHVTSELDRQVPEPADALNRHEVAGARP